MTTTPSLPVSALSDHIVPPPLRPTITTRLAILDDAAQIAALGAIVFAKTFEHSGPTPEQMQDYLSTYYSPAAIAADISSPEKTFFVAATPDRRVVGFIVLLRGSTEECLEGYHNFAELQRLYIDENYHGTGVAQALCQTLTDLARSEGFKHLWLGVWESNFRAQRFYAKLGYRKLGEHGFDVGGDVSTDWVMIKDL